MVIVQDILNKLEDGGYRLTAPRRRLLNVLFSREEGFTAEELTAQVPDIGRATVYRTIRLLVDEGVLCRLAFDDGAPRYTLSQFGHHHHVVCVRCSAVREFRESVMERVLHDLDEGDLGTVVGHRIELYVICAACTAKERKASNAP